MSENITVAKVTPNGGLYVREGKGKSFSHVRVLKQGEEVSVSAPEGGWCEVFECGEPIGYCMAEFLEIEPIQCEPAEGENGAESEHGDSESGELKSMTVEQLKKLAEESGIELKKGMRKDDIIQAILA